jgi:hypothetical protein
VGYRAGELHDDAVAHQFKFELWVDDLVQVVR